MQTNLFLSAFAILLSLIGLGYTSPIRCPDHKIDAIISNRLAPEACCSYGVCLNNVVVAMSVADALEMKGSALRYSDPRVPRAESRLWQLMDALRRR
ncbi:hypothetical protein SAMD00023353_0701890 [Rosellinia necatrix]|uniref:Uncharacterized protein n=1 Tax=Rosellinia necatrix TaxID=77044 RepID=A0A1S7UMM8_ROSNE|nr:hypothetical protein SAMD00023353_0701890 [Rosellinia necatrix]